MLVRVMYDEGKYDMVKDYRLERLISSRKITTFHRSDGWVTIGLDPVREAGRSYSGPERRGKEAAAA